MSKIKQKGLVVWLKALSSTPVLQKKKKKVTLCKTSIAFIK
jgi:hypothetical protein